MSCIFFCDNLTDAVTGGNYRGISGKNSPAQLEADFITGGTDGTINQGNYQTGSSTSLDHDYLVLTFAVILLFFSFYILAKSNAFLRSLSKDSNAITDFLFSFGMIGVIFIVFCFRWMSFVSQKGLSDLDLRQMIEINPSFFTSGFLLASLMPVLIGFHHYGSNLIFSKSTAEDSLRSKSFTGILLSSSGLAANIIALYRFVFGDPFGH